MATDQQPIEFIELIHPDLPSGMRIWNATYKDHAWVISYEPGHPNWSPEERTKWAGYHVSYSKLGPRRSRIIYITEAALPTFEEAVSTANAALLKMM